MFGRKSGKPAVKGNDLTAFIDEGSEIEGKYTFNGTVMLNGRFRGEIVSNDTLIVGEKGVINASIRAGVVLINGEVVGNVMAFERYPELGARKVDAQRAPVPRLDATDLEVGGPAVGSEVVASAVDDLEGEDVAGQRVGAGNVVVARVAPAPDDAARAVLAAADGAEAHLGEPVAERRVLDERPPDGRAAPVDQPALTLRPLGAASARRAERPFARGLSRDGRGHEQRREGEPGDDRPHSSGPIAASTAASTLPSSARARAASRRDRP